MAYIKYKEITKYFYFSQALQVGGLPRYVMDYQNEDELFLVGYRTARDYGVFTSQRILLFDNWGIKKEIASVPYENISSCSVVFSLNGADLSLMLSSGYPLRIKFVKMNDIDKKRLRMIYSCIIRAMSNRKMAVDVVRMLVENDISIAFK